MNTALDAKDHPELHRFVTDHAWLTVCVDNEDFVRAYNEMRGTSVGVPPASPVERLVDKATGKAHSEMRDFLEFCLGCKPY